MSAPALLLGTQGWSYADWVGPMYEPQTRPVSYLRRYAEEFATVEIDSTFYGTPQRERIARWRAAVPASFVFSLKLPREITHDRRLVGAAALLDEFFTVVRDFEQQLGAVLVQLSPDFGLAERGALEDFIPRLPSDVRCAIEFRDAAWLQDDVLQLLRAHDVALALSDGTFVPRARMLELVAAPTAPFSYVRWLGTRDAVSRFDAVTIGRADEIEAWRAALALPPPRARTVFGYVNNHYQGHAPATVRALYAALGIPHRRPSRVEQPSLFA